MTTIVRDGFDHYVGFGNPGTDPGGKWASVGNGNLIYTARFGRGKAFSHTSVGGDLLVPAGGPFSNENTWFLTSAFMQASSLSGSTQGHGYILKDGSTAQVGIWFRTDGAIIVRSGGSGATIIATFLNAFAANSYDHWEFKIIIHPTAGEVHIRRNDGASDYLVATGLNTRGGTSNSYANTFSVNSGGNIIGAGHVFDDLWVFNGNAASVPYDWIGDVRAVQQYPTFDTAQKDFSRSATGTSLAVGSGTNSRTLNMSPGTLYPTRQLTGCSQGGVFTTLNLDVNAGFTGNMRVGVYLADGDVLTFSSFITNAKLGDLVAVSNVLVNPVTGLNTVTFPSAVAIPKGWGTAFVVQTDTACVVKSNNTGNSYGTFFGTFAGGLPDSLAGVTSLGGTDGPAISQTLTASNAGCINDWEFDETTTYIFDSTVGHYDLYQIQPLYYAPVAILGVDYIARVSKSDAGGRGSKITGDSGGTTFQSSEYNPLTTYSWQILSQDLDPHTSGAWTRAAIEALKIGMLVSS